MKRTTKIIFFILAFMNMNAWAKITCDNSKLTFSGKNVVLKVGQRPQVFLFYNKGQQDFWLTRLQANPSASAGWNSLLKSKNWSALLLDSSKNNFVLSCGQMQAGQTTTINCRKQLKICAVKNIVLGQHTQGSYWLTENQTRQNLKPALAKRGVKLNQ